MAEDLLHRADVHAQHQKHRRRGVPGVVQSAARTPATARTAITPSPWIGAGNVCTTPALINSEAKLRQMFDKLARHGSVLVVVEQPALIGALPVAVARACGHEVAYLPGLARRRIADLHPGAAKTDARDAYVIADAARTLPHTLRRVDVGDEASAELEVLVGFDDDLAGEATRLANRIRGLLTQIQPALERVLGPKVQHKAVLDLLSRCGGPAGLHKAGRSKLRELASKNAPAHG